MTNEHDVAVSVVVPTHGRAGLLEALVGSLLVQETDIPYEVVIVDDASPDDTAAELSRLAQDDPTGRLRCLRLARNRGPAHARNVGIAATSGKVILFTDDDCIATPAWVEAIARPILEDRFDVVQGRTAPRPDQPRRGEPWTRSQSIRSLTGLYEGCNIAYRRDLLERIGGFRIDFPSPAGEDTELGLRAAAAGARVGFVEDALVHHEVWSLTFREALADRTRTGQLPMLVRLRPEIRRQLPLRVFWRDSHVKVCIVGVAAVTGAAVRPWLGPAAPLTWVLYRAARIRRGPPRLNDIEFATQRCVADVWEVAVTIAGAVRHRTFLL